jgi:V/A-type H+-transporting ATPase subunit D
VERLTATRSELLARKNRLDLARRGRDLLEEKRDQLMTEFRKVADLVLSGEGALETAASAAQRALAEAEAFDGRDRVRSAGTVGALGIPLQARQVHIMGVRIADIEYGPVRRSVGDRGYDLVGSSARIDRAADLFETELELVLELAGRELRLRRLVEEIAGATRRVNALENIVIPRLERENIMIQSVLDERERQDRFRLKRAKKQRQRRHEKDRVDE